MPPVNDVDRLQPLGGAHEHVLVPHEQVAALDDFDAHLPREIGVLEIGAVVGARRQQHHPSDTATPGGAMYCSIFSSSCG